VPTTGDQRTGAIGTSGKGIAIRDTGINGERIVPGATVEATVTTVVGETAATITATLGMVTGMAGIGTDTPGTLTGMAGIGTGDTGVTIETAITTGETGATITTGETETTTFSVSMDGPSGEATGEVIGVDGPTTPITTTGLPIIAAIHSPISSCRGFPSCSACKGIRHGKGGSGTPKRSLHWSEKRHCSCWVWHDRGGNRGHLCICGGSKGRAALEQMERLFRQSRASMAEDLKKIEERRQEVDKLAAGIEAEKRRVWEEKRRAVEELRTKAAELAGRKREVAAGAPSSSRSGGQKGIKGNTSHAAKDSRSGKKAGIESGHRGSGRAMASKNRGRGGHSPGDQSKSWRGSRKIISAGEIS